MRFQLALDAARNASAHQRRHVRRGSLVALLWVSVAALWTHSFTGIAGATQSQRLALGSDGRGVSVSHRDGYTFSYGPGAVARYKLIAGRTVEINCDHLTAPHHGWILDRGGVSALRHAPVARAQISTGPITAPADFCSLALVTGRNRERVVAIVPLTVRGLDYLDQEDAARDIYSVWLAFAGPGAPPDPQQLLSTFDGVLLPTEHSLPPRGKLGVFRKGQHDYVAKRDRTGLLLFLQEDGVVARTNMLGYVTDSPGDRGPYLNQTRAIQRA
jgi:hypothetical protein